MDETGQRNRQCCIASELAGLAQAMLHFMQSMKVTAEVPQKTFAHKLRIATFKTICPSSLAQETEVEASCLQNSISSDRARLK